jgi:hypothetical protein
MRCMHLCACCGAAPLASNPVPRQPSPASACCASPPYAPTSLVVLPKAQQALDFAPQPVSLPLHPRRPLQCLLLRKLRVRSLCLELLCPLVRRCLLRPPRVRLRQQVLMQPAVLGCQSPCLALQNIHLRKGYTGGLVGRGQVQRDAPDGPACTSQVGRQDWEA